MYRVAQKKYSSFVQFIAKSKGDITLKQYAFYSAMSNLNFDIYHVEGDRGARTRENRGRRWTGSGRRRSGMQESCEGGRQEMNERH